MDGLMMEWPLTLTHLYDRARRLFPAKQVVTRGPQGVVHHRFAEWGDRTEQLASALARAGVRPGDRVATLCWNSHQHLELYFAVPLMGAVLHAVNFRLFPEQVAHIMNHAEDTLVFVDGSVYPLVEKLRPHLTTVRDVIVVDDTGAGTPAGATGYEEFLATGEVRADWPVLQENQAAGMCYTSGTTGHPKACLYSHRSQVLHAMGVGLSGLGFTEADRALIIVPMFHVNAWGFPYGIGLLGYDVVFPGRFMMPPDLLELVEGERVTFVSGVPTIVGGMLQALQQAPRDVSSIRQIVIGGSALPRTLIDGFRERFGIPVCQGWGMTETSPVATIGGLRPHHGELPLADQTGIRLKAGRPLPMVEVRVMTAEGTEAPWDGRTTGELQVRGPWVIGAYYQDPRSPECFDDGWFRTGDVAAIDPEGYVIIVDRLKDLVKSGGEWISSVDLENAIMGHPEVAEAAVIGVSHPKWQERPLACVVARNPELTPDAVLGFLKDKVADWWLPDAVVLVEALPKTSVGKFDKKVLRAQFHNYLTDIAKDS